MREEPASRPGREPALPPSDVRPRQSFSVRVAGVLLTRVLQFGFALLLTFSLARLLGPDGRGVYYTLTLIPGTLYALATFGLPSSLTFFAARGAAIGTLRRQAILLGLASSAWLVAGTVLLLPVLAGTALNGVPLDLLPWVLATIPFQLTGSLLGNLLYGRQEIRAYNAIQVAQAGGTLLLALALVAGLRLGVLGAIAAYFVAAAVGAIATLLELARVVRKHEAATGDPVPVRRILGYGVRLYPGVVTNFFTYRADVYLLNWLLGSVAAVGLYSLAVSLAEISFYVPDAVGSLLLPRVAASDREAADGEVADITRLTFLLTAVATLGILPAGVAAIALFLPAFTGSIPALVVLLPAVLALSLAKVLGGYVTGLGAARPLVIASVASLVVNVGANLVLIPTLGIVGASTASLLSYSTYAVLLVRSASRLGGVPARRFVIPERDDAQRLATGLRQAAARLRRTAPTPPPGGRP